MHYLGAVPQTAEVGGKARELDRMIRGGLNVPAGAVFDVSSWTDASWKDELQESLKKLGKIFAVRSSSLSEDTDEHSMAGMFISKTRVPSDSVIEAIEDVLHQATQLHGRLIPVIVQAWVEGTVSGVAFSQHPTKSLGDVFVIDAAKGTAEKIVSGEVTPSRCFIWPDARLVPSDSPLSDGLITALQAQITWITKLFGKPTDIEWTTDGTSIFILQARPMTRIPSERTDEIEEGRIMRRYCADKNLRLERADYAETIPRPSPAGLELLRACYASDGPFARASKELGLSFDITAAQNYFTTIFGWLYADAAHEPITPPKGFFEKLLLSIKLQNEILSFPKAFYATPPVDVSTLNGIQGTNYAKAALLARAAAQRKFSTPIYLQEIWKRRQAWLENRPRDITAQDFELTVAAPIMRRKDWTPPRTLIDLYAILREDAKDELRPLFDALRQTYLEHEPTQLQQDELANNIRLPLTLRWTDLFDLQQAYFRESQTDGLHGTGVSEGSATGPAVIAVAPRSINRGSILIVPSLMPDWFPYLTDEISGIISETGSLMSHGAIQCRERGIPAVFGAIGATQAIKAGETVSLDGKRGIVTVYI